LAANVELPYVEFQGFQVLFNITNIESLKLAASCSLVSSQSKDIQAPFRLHCYHDVRTIGQAARDKHLQVAAAVLWAFFGPS
jgi:hypothetical protein